MGFFCWSAVKIHLLTNCTIWTWLRGNLGPGLTQAALCAPHDRKRRGRRHSRQMRQRTTPSEVHTVNYTQLTASRRRTLGPWLTANHCFWPQGAALRIVCCVLLCGSAGTAGTHTCRFVFLPFSSFLQQKKKSSISPKVVRSTALCFAADCVKLEPQCAFLFAVGLKMKPEIDSCEDNSDCTRRCCEIRLQKKERKTKQPATLECPSSEILTSVPDRRRGPNACVFRPRRPHSCSRI